MISTVLVASGLVHALLLLLLPLWARGQRLGPEAHEAAVDVVVPARDEAANIARCVRAALDSGGVEQRVFVVDDHSGDGTMAQARVAGGDDPRLQVVPSPPLPPGWAGKCWACQTGGELGQAEFLLFVDADVTLAVGAPARLVAWAERRTASLVSAYGTWRLVGWWERLLVPPIGWAVRGWADPARVASGDLAFANGQCLLVRRRAWESLGGHGAVAGDVLDDVALARVFSAAGHHLELVWAPDAFAVRPYDSLTAILDGYGKNLLPALGGRRWLALLLASSVFIFGLGPWFALVTALPGPGPGVLPASTVCALMVGHRLAIERLDGRGGAMALGHPLATALLVWLLLKSAFQRRVWWRGRSFVAGTSDGERGGKG